MDKKIPYFKAKVVNNDPMTNPVDGWVEGFYYEDLCLDEERLPLIMSFIRSGEMVWRVIPDSTRQRLPLKDSNGKYIYDGDIINIMCDDGSNANCLVGFNEEELAWGIMEAHQYALHKEGWETSFYPTFLNNCRNSDTSIRIIGNIYDNENLLLA